MQGRQNRVPVPNQNWSSSGGMGRGSLFRVTSNRGGDGAQHQMTGPELFVPEHPEDKASASSHDSGTGSREQLRMEEQLLPNVSLLHHALSAFHVLT